MSAGLRIGQRPGWAARATAALLLVAACIATGAQDAQRQLELASFPRTALEITVGGSHSAPAQRFEVWVADTPERAMQGLMFVRDLPATRGMVFPVTPPQIETMWMKNTYIELDMLFIGADGRVTKIIERATPLSLAILSSDTPVAAVLELKGGEAARRGLKVGNRVSWRKPAA